VPGVSVVAVAQLVAGSVATHSVVPPDLNVMVPVALTGRPDVESVSAVPYGMVAGAADSVIDVLAFVTVKLAPVATALV
jgi:hypothetical protein